MNNARRKALEQIAEQLESLKSDLEELLGEEEEYRDNMPENLQSSERYETADNACDNMQSAIYSLEEAIDYISESQS